MYPGSASNTAAAAASKFQNRCASPQFASFAPPPPADYPPPMLQQQHQQQQQQQQQQQLQQQLPGQTTAVAVHSAPGHGSMRHLQRNQLTMSGHAGHGHGLGHGHGGGSVHGHAHGHGHGLGISGGLGHGAATLGHHHHGHRGDLIFPDDMDSIEFCMPAAPTSSQQNGEIMLLQGGHNEAFTERRRRGHSRRSNHKMDVEQQVKWSRKNIAATMERFEPTSNTQSSSSTSSLDYGFAAGVMTPSSSSATPSHGTASQAGMSSTASLHVAYNGAGAGGSSGSGGVASGGNNGGGAVGGAGSAAAAAAAPFNHVYSYAYYEPGAAKCHTNVPAQAGQGNGHHHQHGHSKSPPRNSIRALLAKSFRSKSSSHSGQSTSSSPSAEERDRHTYTTRYGTTENLYEEVSDQKIRKVLSDNRIATSSVGNVKEELRRVQHNHFRVLDELNLSLEALIMPPTPPDVSPSHVGSPGASPGDGPHEVASSNKGLPSGSANATLASSSSAAANCAAVVQAKSMQRPRRGGLLGGAAASAASNASSASHASLENLSSTLNSMELKDHAHSSCINPEFDEGDLDSGFSGSGSSSGASYNESLRYYKTGTPTTSHSHSHHSHGHSAHLPQQQQQQLQLQQQYNNNNSSNSGSSSQNNNHIHTHALTNTNTLPHNLRSCRSSTASGTSTSKSSMASCGEDQGIAGMGMGLGMNMGMGMGMNMGGMNMGMGGMNMTMGSAGMAGMGGMGGMAMPDTSAGSSMSPFNFARRCSADQQRNSGRSIASASGSAAGTVVPMATGAKPKKNFWTMKP